MDKVTRELDTAVREMEGCHCSGANGCPALKMARAVAGSDLEASGGRGVVTPVATCVETIERCERMEGRCRPYYLMKDVFLRLIR